MCDNMQAFSQNFKLKQKKIKKITLFFYIHFEISSH